ncbi:hypothetical protein VTI74DRAFT_2355 [Chaetomium olivicolor]
MLLSTLLLAAAASAGVVIIPSGGNPKPYTGPAGLTLEDAFFRESGPNEFFNNTAKLNFYMLSHAEEIRSLFVDPDGQQEIVVEDFTWYDVLRQFSGEIQLRVKTDWLWSWMRPQFTTTTESDLMTANVLMMGLTKAYFKYRGKLLSDWEALLAKLDHLIDFGPDAAEYGARLRPILSWFVKSFEDPDSPATRKFWNQIVSPTVRHVCGEPPVYVSGWITGFYFGDDDSNSFGRTPSSDRKIILSINVVAYPVLDPEFALVGYARAPFTMLEYGGMENFPDFVATATLGKQITLELPEGYE